MRHALPLAPLLALVAGCATTRPAASEAEPLAGLFGSSMPTGERDAAIRAAAAFPLGSEKNPVRANLPPGQRAYLSRLRCASGDAPAFERNGNVGEGPFGTIVDLYQVTCPGSAPVSVYIDMYHGGHVEARAVPGFTIVR